MVLITPRLVRPLDPGRGAAAADAAEVVPARAGTGDEDAPPPPAETARGSAPPGGNP